MATCNIEIFNRVVHLSLDDSAYTDAMVEHICALERLESLSLSGTEITAGGLDRIRRALPHCRITRRDG